MGDPKLPKKKYSRPTHPWHKARIEKEKILIRDYGLKNKKEVWKMESVLRSAKSQAKRLTVQTGEQAQKEKKQLLTRFHALGLIPKDATLEDVLGLETTHVLERRLQTILVRKKLAHSMRQARQFISHGHVQVEGKRITIPSYLVKSSEEKGVGFSAKSPISNEMHPERVQAPVMAAPKSEQVKSKKPAPENKDDKKVSPKNKEAAPDATKEEVQ